MLTKLMPALAAAIFGALMFIAGLIAPAPLRATFENFVRRIEPGTAATVPMMQAASASAAAASTAAAALAPQTPIWEESLAIPSLLPEKGQYGLQVGKFFNAVQAQALVGHIKALQLPFSRTLTVVDQSGTLSTIVPLGPYASLNEARAARSLIAQELNLSGPLTLILWPANSAATGASSAPGLPAASSPVAVPEKS